MIGPGIYDKECEALLRENDADGVILQVFGGERGSGFSVSTTSLKLVEELPAILRHLADQIETDAKKLKLQ